MADLEAQLLYWRDMARHQQETVKKLSKALRAMSWIPCYVAQPEHDGRYQVTIDNRLTDICYFRFGRWVDIVGQTAYPINVTAWRVPDEPFRGGEKDE